MLYNIITKKTIFFFFKFFNFNFFLQNNIEKTILPITTFSYSNTKNKITYLNILFYYNNFTNFTNFIYNETLHNGCIYVYGEKQENLNGYLYFYSILKGISCDTNINKLYYLLKLKKISSIFFFESLETQQELKLKYMMDSVAITIGFSSILSETNYMINLIIPYNNLVYKYIYGLHFVNISLLAIRQRKIRFIYLYLNFFKKINYLTKLI